MTSATGLLATVDRIDRGAHLFPLMVMLPVGQALLVSFVRAPQITRNRTTIRKQTPIQRVDIAANQTFQLLF